MIESVDVVIKQAGHADRPVRLSDGATRMGRAEDNEIVLSDVGVSRRHAQVYVSRGEVSVEDLGSGNGTYYNGYRIQSQPVQDGDEIVIDPFILHFRIRGQERHDEPRGASPSPARLQVVVGSGMAGSSYPVTSRGLSVGRSEDRDVVIADPAASRHHCQIAVQGGEYVFRDMGSANGVFVNAVRVRECTLADGDLIRIGNTEMRFVREGAGGGGSTAGRPPEPVQRAQQGNWAPEPANRRDPYSDPPVKRSSKKPLFAVLVAGTIVLVGVVTVTLLLIVATVVLFQTQAPFGATTTAVGPATRPRWTLNLPMQLDAAPVDALFEQGRAKMQEQDYKAALQDFYRVMDVDPGYLYVDKFAYAAGEYLVHDALLKELNRQFVAKAQREAERDQLLEDYKEGNRSVHLRAARILKRQYGDDPLVMKALDLQAPPALAALEKLDAEGADAVKGGHFDEASKKFADVLDGSKDGKVRAAALANLKLAQKEVARESTELWAQAVLAESTGDKADAKTLFFQLREQHPSNPSTQFHLDRLP